MTSPSGVQSYSTTPAENIAANTGVTWDEGMSPGLVNNSARQNMADLRAAFDDLIWFQYGSGSKAPAPTYSSGTAFTQASGSDLSAVYHVGRRVKAVGSGTGTIYGSISSTSYATSTQTVNVTWDSGSLSNEALTIYLSQVPVTGSPVPHGAVVENLFENYGAFATTLYTTTSVTPGVMVGNGALGTLPWLLTLKTTGKIEVVATGMLATDGSVAQEGFLGLRWGTGTPPAQGAAATGTKGNTLDTSALSSASQVKVPFSIRFRASPGVGNTVWVDGAIYGATSGKNTTVFWTGVSIREV